MEILEVKYNKLIIDLTQIETVKMFDNSTVELCIGTFNCVRIGFKDIEQTNKFFNQLKVELSSLVETSYCKNKVV